VLLVDKLRSIQVMRQLLVLTNIVLRMRSRTLMFSRLTTMRSDRSRLIELIKLERLEMSLLVKLALML